MNRYKLLALDLDGTLLNSREVISNTNLPSIRSESIAGWNQNHHNDRPKLRIGI